MLALVLGPQLGQFLVECGAEPLLAEEVVDELGEHPSATEARVNSNKGTTYHPRDAGTCDRRNTRGRAAPGGEQQQHGGGDKGEGGKETIAGLQQLNQALGELKEDRGKSHDGPEVEGTRRRHCSGWAFTQSCRSGSAGVWRSSRCRKIRERCSRAMCVQFLIELLVQDDYERKDRERWERKGRQRERTVGRGRYLYPVSRQPCTPAIADVH